MNLLSTLLAKIKKIHSQESQTSRKSNDVIRLKKDLIFHDYDAEIRRLEKEVKDIDDLCDECMAINDLALKFEQEGRVDEAINQYEKCIQKNWSGSLTYDRLIKIYMNRFDYQNVKRICNACNKNIKNSQSVAVHSAIISGIDEFLMESTSKLIGQRSPICPNCGINLENMPKKKLKCNACQKSIYIESRPIDGLKVLLTEKGVDQVHEQWALVRGTYESYREERKTWVDTKNQLFIKFGREPTAGDIQWQIFINNSIKFSKNLDWVSYRNNRYEMALFLKREKKFDLALRKFLEVFCIDVNGPINLKDPRWHGVSEPMAMFMPKFGGIKTAVIKNIRVVMKASNINKAELEKNFVVDGQKVISTLHLPISWDQVFKQLLDALNEDDKSYK